MVVCERDNPKRRGAYGKVHIEVFLIMEGFVQGLASSSAAKNDKEG